MIHDLVRIWVNIFFCITRVIWTEIFSNLNQLDMFKIILIFDDSSASKFGQILC